jgi:hypothetical protein
LDLIVEGQDGGAMENRGPMPLSFAVNPDQHLPEGARRPDFFGQFDRGFRIVIVKGICEGQPYGARCAGD